MVFELLELHLFLTDEGGKDRKQAFEYLASNFLPNSVLEIAYQADKASEHSSLNS